MKLSSRDKSKLFYSLFIPATFVFLIWIIKLIEVQLKADFGPYGILPREAIGLRGVIFGPLIHGSFEHLINNSIPLLLLGMALFYFYRQIAFKVFVLSFLLSGLYTWISARYSFHIGASGIVYSLFAFLLISGFIRKHIQLIAISFLVAFLYGSLIWGVLPWDQTVSWEGHFWGFMVGAILAVFYRKQGPQRKEYHWEEDEESEVQNETIHDQAEDGYWNSDSSQPEIKYTYRSEENRKRPKS